ncbi:GNAT family N-acetyltransferase [Kitasatospora sp. NPDC094016]|uniref:GNAT family N-acetyltransferase n=1 Tax=Kitasatospora sp. NPDC094016 TaxID=3154986 RepID=UPI00331A6949
MSITLRRYGPDSAAGIHGTVLDLHDAGHPPTAFPNCPDPRARFSWLLDSWTQEAGWECVIGYDGEVPVGFAHGAPLAPGTSWWRCLLTPPDPAFTEETGLRTFALADLVVSPQWRGRGVGARIHEGLLAGRPERRATLLVDADHPKVRALYESWGYSPIGPTMSFDHAERMTAMVRETC